MRWIHWLVLLGLVVAWPARAESGRIIKVLPHLLDAQGRHALRPSLYERDAYQAFLRRNPERRTALRFDVQWKSSEPGPLRLQVELRGNLRGEARQATLEQPVKKSWWFSRWSSAALSGEAYKEFGELYAWRATLWQGDRLVAEQRSFLW